ncbi:MAG TPA: sialidase family protein [Thermoanaerobaculia bacterium]|nr:sialidase family protein [Thermoanaerobaculia bacterium]
MPHLRRCHALLLMGVTVLAFGTGPLAAEPASPAPLSPTERRAILRPLYDALQKDPRLLALRGGRLSPAARDRWLTSLPISPLEVLEIDQQARRYEIMIPGFVHELHARWIQLHPEQARRLYGDARVEAALSGWPADTGSEVELGLRASVGANHNLASTSNPAPLWFQGEVQVAVNPNNPNQIVAAANSTDTMGGSCEEGILAVYFSNDGGATWGYTCPPTDSGFGLVCTLGYIWGSDPALSWNDANEVFLNYMLICSEGLGVTTAMVVARSTDGGASWNGQGVIKNSWELRNVIEDKNFYAVDTHPTSPFYGRHYTCWHRNNNTKMAYSSNNGASWTEVDVPAAAGNSEDLGCEMAVEDNGTLHLIFDSMSCGQSTCSDEKTYATRSTNGGASWSAAVLVHDSNLVGFSGANCPAAMDSRCIFPLGAIAVDNSGGACDGNLYVTLGDYPAGGNVNDNDVWLIRSTNGGTSWSAPVRVNDAGVTGRAQFHPFAQVDAATGHVFVAWYDARHDTENQQVDVFVARSTDCGVSFEPNVQVTQPSPEFNNSGISWSNESYADNPNIGALQYGEYLGLDVVAGKAYLAWTDSRHFFPGSSTEPQRENIGFAIVDFSASGPSCGNGVIDPPEVCDGGNLGGQTCQSQGWNGGTLGCAATCLTFDTAGCNNDPVTLTLTSIAAEDGWVRESSETSNEGGALAATESVGFAVRAGDDKSDRQWKGILSFDTSAIPDGATVQDVTLELVRGALAGTNPFDTHGSLRADVVSGAFGGNPALEIGDFQAAASALAACTLSPVTASGQISQCTLNAAGVAAVNKTGRTQVRIAFTLDDNDDRGDDYVGFYSGEASFGPNQPRLVVTYQ